ncbi:STAS domain-containing protein [Herbaspirillum sp. LeCh32-8]|uniref:STAS domain-containing protein n=1 Tax=Herbaspirillum sp. LeCh32-8 TaxID=2821356 RepID=UPI001AE63AA1|nr:STAS domain-containing protein [Herbaspirillum sp. LeCh32-8]MBP0599837.1 STAS domain-containing protein [Herbaspirillum sp. LeCh32-8]
MTSARSEQLAATLNQHQQSLLDNWLKTLTSKLGRKEKGGEFEIRRQAEQFLQILIKTLETGAGGDTDSADWADMRHLLGEVSRTRALQGFSSLDTATFVFALKEPLYEHLRIAMAAQPEQLALEIASTSTLFDKLGLYTIEVHQKAREQVILRQQQELLELSTPVVQLWQNVLALPLIGTLDSSRTQVVMESLLQKIVETGAMIAIIDITGVPTVDTLVAQHLLKTIAAARLMGADCIISGIRPQIAQTIVHLGVNLEDVITKATLADAFMVALKKTGSRVTVQSAAE